MSKHSLLDFGRDQSGAMSIEALFWLTLVAFTTAVFVDSTAMFAAQSRVLRIAHDANRAYSTGVYKTPAEVEEAIELRLAGVSPTVDAVSTLSPDGTLIMTNVTAPGGDFQVFGTIPSFQAMNVSVWATHLDEDV